MSIGRRTFVVLLCAIALSVGTGVSIHGQQSRSRQVTAAGPTLPAEMSRVDALLRDGSLDIGTVHEDTMMPGRTHERLVQRYEGLPVFGGEVVRQMNGRLPVSVHGRLFDNVALATVRPAIDENAAIAAAERVAGPDASARGVELGVLPMNDRYVLVYRMTVRQAFDIRRYFINAATGVVEHTERLIRHQLDVPAVGTGTGVLSDKKKVSANQAGVTWEMIDLLRPAEIYTLSFHGSVSRLNRFFQTGDLFFSDIATSTSNSWTDGSLVDAHVYSGWVYDYYYKRFGRRSLDDRNIPIISIVHPLARSEASRYDDETVNLLINNAAYFGDGLMIYGDGDGVDYNFFAGSLDIVAHELTHGVTEFSSRLGFRDEPGALNEAFSDIMAVGAEYFFQKAGQGPQKGPNFLVGEDITRTAPFFIRSLQNPVAGGYPDHYSLRLFIGTEFDDGGVHVNSTIVGHAFYLAVAGGTNRVSGIPVQGVGVANMERMERVFYRAFSFMLGPQSRFTDARAATLQAASDLFGAGSPERSQLLQAWNAVGVQ